MKIAVISDLHGNLEAFESVIEDIEKHHVDHLICAGDTNDPLKESLDIWNRLKELKVPCLRGNHEDYIVDYHFGNNPEKWNQENFKPIKLVAEHLGPEIAKEFQALPLDLVIEGPDNQHVHLCHASPISNSRSFYNDKNEDILNSIRNSQACVFASGHRHLHWDDCFEDNLLISFGSLGIPLNGKPEAEYLLLTYQDKNWKFEHKSVSYNFEKTLKDYRESGWAHQGGPIAWLLHDEILTGEKRVSKLFKYIHRLQRNPKNKDEWSELAKAYMKEIDRLTHISDFLI